ncbi:MAG TPA: 3-deoxy-manno-octulosonate cytidylyltransferase [Thiothrix sp.]|nr:3-deoxy-manno-octulosonate cytidylyltransferase [Thiothrix sp.]
MSNTLHIVIPSRYNSSRLPGKPLKLIAGKTMIERVYQQAVKSGIESICVATDDVRIQKAVEDFGGQVVMTREDHQSGTDRLAEVSEKQGWDDDDVVINLQGDEPLMPPEVIQFLADIAVKTDAGISTLATPIWTMDDVFNPNIVKVVMDATGKAHYFSRAPIPWDRDNWLAMTEEVKGKSATPRYRHLGMYAYRVGMLKKIPTLPPCEVEKIESLEQLRPLYNGIDIQVGIIENAPDHGIDTEADLLRVNALFSVSS